MNSLFSLFSNSPIILREEEIFDRISSKISKEKLARFVSSWKAKFIFKKIEIFKNIIIRKRKEIQELLWTLGK